MTLDQLRYFIEAARFEHVGRAAKSIPISPSAISGAIAALEEELGGELFERRGKNVVLNSRGKRLKEEAERLLDQVASLQRSVGEADAALDGSFRFGASHVLATRLLGPAWNALQHRQPRVRADLCSMPTVEVIRQVISGELDAGIVISPLSHPDVRETVLHRGELLLAVRRGHPLLEMRSDRVLRELGRYPAILHKSAPGVGICESHPMFETFGIVPDIHLSFDNDEFAVQALLASDSWAMLPEFVVAASPRLEALALPRGWDAPYWIAGIVRRNRESNRVLGLFVDELTKLEIPSRRHP